MRVALFVRNGLVGHEGLNQVIPQIIKLGFEPVIYNTGEPPSKKGSIPELADVSFYETGLLKDVVFPYLDVRPPLLEHGKPIEGLNYSHRQLAQIYGLKYYEVTDVNDTDLIENITADDLMVGAISIRILQIFKPEIISVFEQKGFMWNLHTGILPKYKGVHTPYWCIENNEEEYGWTLHRIDRGIDTGPILAIDRMLLDPEEPILNIYLNMCSKGANLILTELKRYLENGVPSGQPQTKEIKSYYTFPTGQDMKKWEAKGVVFSHIPSIPDIYISRFSAPNSVHAQKLRENIIQAIAEHERSKSEYEEENTLDYKKTLELS